MTNIDQEVKQLITQAENTFKEYEAYEVVTMEGFNISGEHLKTIKTKMKMIEDKRKEYVDPLNKTIRTINADFKKPMEYLKNAEGIVKNAMLNYKQKIDEENRIKEEKRQAEIQKELDKATKKHDVDKIINLVGKKHDDPIVEKPKVQGIHTTKKWKHKIKDVNKIPPEYMIPAQPNDKILASVAITSKGKAIIPGVEFYEDETMNVRA